MWQVLSLEWRVRRRRRRPGRSRRPRRRAGPNHVNNAFSHIENEEINKCNVVVASGKEADDTRRTMASFQIITMAAAVRGGFAKERK